MPCCWDNFSFCVSMRICSVKTYLANGVGFSIFCFADATSLVQTNTDTNLMKFMISDPVLPTLHTFSLIRPTLFDFNPLVRIGHTPATFSAVALLHSSTQSSIFFTVTKAPTLLHVLLLQRTTPVSRPFVRFRSCFFPLAPLSRAVSSPATWN